MSTAHNPAADAEEWISRADAAELARCHEATINRDQKDHELDTRSGPNGKTMLRLADLVRIGRIQPGDIPAGASPAGQDAVIQRATAATGPAPAARAAPPGRPPRPPWPRPRRPRTRAGCPLTPPRWSG